MKRNNKAKLSLVLAAAMALSLTACGPKEPSGSQSGAASGSMSSSQSASGSTSQPETPTPPAPVPDPTPDPEPAPDPGPDLAKESLDQLRVVMEPSAAIAGVFFLGVNEGEPLDQNFFEDANRAHYMEKYPFMKEINMGRYVQTAGTEVYCIVPADPAASVVVTEWDESEGPVAGEVLYESKTGEPFFVQGNVSDIMPNLAITITDGYGNVLDQYHPSISLRDGSVSTETNNDDLVVLDLTEK